MRPAVRLELIQQRPSSLRVRLPELLDGLPAGDEQQARCGVHCLVHLKQGQSWSVTPTEAMVRERQVTPRGVCRDRAVHDGDANDRDGDQHALEQSEPLVEPVDGDLLELVGRAEHRDGLAVRLERLAAAPLGEVEQPGRVVDVLVQSNDTAIAGWKRELLDCPLNHGIGLVCVRPKLAQNGDAQESSIRRCWSVNAGQQPGGTVGSTNVKTCSRYCEPPNS